MTDQAKPDTRDVDMEVQVDAPADAVWRALTQPEEISRWFAPSVSGEPGPGGHITVSWGGGEWTSKIVAWDVGRHLGLRDMVPEGQEAPEPGTALDYFVEEREGKTVVRMVNSGFSAGDDWDDYFHMLENGWAFFLWNLRHYLERHRGSPRNMISSRPWVSGSRDEVWERVFGPEGIADAPDGAGKPFTMTLGDTTLEGESVLSDRPWAFAGRLSSLDDGVIHVEMEGAGDRWKMGLWLSGYGVDPSRCEELQSALDAQMARLFPESD
ncbi:MAG: SRPBCC domain-containing protein [Gemmatimonadetes bacterium]|nr:SRPBCC domain-containing protein [Gemmatimonadota bacterium]